MNNIMHHKFAVFGRQTSKDACVWTGSFNFTKSARYNNQENAVIIAQAEVVGVFLEQFERIKQQRCVNCPKNSTVVAHYGHGKVKKNKKMILARA
jgi:phosphatidylserine/phosphatidylglycerophosphate/cardiolipin synthase-like enzyme